jgi:hypothetical protein
MSKKVIYGIFDDEEVLLDSVKEVRSKDISSDGERYMSGINS